MESKKADNKKDVTEEELVPYQNREISWTYFNERVLDEAANAEVPLAERLTFASIYQTNLDEFFRVRVGTLMTQLTEGDETRENKLNMTCDEQISAILKRVKSLEKKKSGIYSELMKELEPKGVRLTTFAELTDTEASILEKYFDNRIVPYLAPMVVGNGQPFPFLNNGDIYAIALMLNKSGKRRIGIVRCSNGVFKRLVEIPTKEGTYILGEELILHFITKLFSRYMVEKKSLLRVTRNADIDAEEIYDEEHDFRNAMEILIKRRTMLAPVRLELTRTIDAKGKKELAYYLNIDTSNIVMVETPLDMSFVFELQNILAEKNKDDKSLFYVRRNPRLSPDVDMRKSIIEQIEKKDVLLSYPYESMRTYISMLEEAADTPEVTSIKITLYRTADRSKIVDALVEAAENGKEVQVLVELRARFDEANNIDVSKRLEDAGCKVVYGLNSFKVHSKLCLVTINREGKESYITQIGTGNYNEKTASLYTDLCIMTANQEFGEDAKVIFEHLLKKETVKETSKLLVAPEMMQKKMLSLMDEEIVKAKTGRQAFIGIKINSLTDKVLIDKLIEASEAGVCVKMIIRGICCMVPGIPGVTDNIQVVSVVGRYLEHSRIYRFGCGDEEQVYISSADFMTRNMIRRVEVAAPILDKEIKDRVRYIFDTTFDDNVKARVLQPDGSYAYKADVEKHGRPKLNAQEKFFEESYTRWRSKFGH